MTNLEFSMNLPSEPEELIKFSMDYKSFVNYLPDHIKNIVIVETRPDEIITDEILIFRSLFSATITQRSSHKRNGNVLSTQIISGPFKNSRVEVTYHAQNPGTMITIVADLKIPLKYKILSLAIKKMYRNLLRGILYKINNEIIKSKE